MSGQAGWKRNFDNPGSSRIASCLYDRKLLGKLSQWPAMTQHLFGIMHKIMLELISLSLKLLVKIAAILVNRKCQDYSDQINV